MADLPLRVLELCAGFGGISLGLQLSGVPTRTVCMVEREAHAVAVLGASMEAGWLDPAPVWSDLCTFDARPWRGAVDLVTAGFPCQPFSLAGKREHERDPRHVWPQIARIIDECRPELVFLENVQLRAFVEPLRDLRGMGYRVPPALRVSASDVGAPHQRDRWWVLGCLPDASRNAVHVEHRRRNGQSRTGEAISCGDGSSVSVADASGERLAQGRSSRRPSEEQPEPPFDSWWESEPAVGRVVDGCPDRVDQLRLLGNGVVPLAAAFAFRTLFDSRFDR